MMGRGRAHKLQSQLREKGLHEAGWQRDLVDHGGPGNVECLVDPALWLILLRPSELHILAHIFLASHI